MPAGKTKSPKGKVGSKKRTVGVSGAARAGIVFAPARCTRLLRQGRYSERMGMGAGAYMAGVLQYITEELCELAGDMCESRKRKTISPEHLNLAMRSDHELAKLMYRATISQGGMLPNINEFLVPKKKGGKSTNGDASQPV
jgi:histone H2A